MAALHEDVISGFYQANLKSLVKRYSRTTALIESILNDKVLDYELYRSNLIKLNVAIYSLETSGSLSGK